MTSARTWGFVLVNYTVFAWCWWARSSQSLKLVAASSGVSP